MRGPRTDKDLRTAGSEWEQDGRFSGRRDQGLREVVWGPSLGLVNFEEGLTFRLQGSSWPPSIDFRVEATGLTSQLNLGETSLLLWLLMLVPVKGVGPLDHPKWNSSPVSSLCDLG